MYSNKQYSSKINKVLQENEALSSKLEIMKAEISVLKSKNRCLKQQVKASKQSRSNWKSKYKAKSTEATTLAIKLNERDYLERHPYPSSLMKLAVMLRMEGSISYCATCRVLEILNNLLSWDFDKLPCANTIQNWVAKTGLHHLESSGAAQNTKQVSLIVDESIRLGQERLLLALLVDAQKDKQEALSMQDVEVFFMKGSPSWSGVIVEQELTEKLAKTGYEVISFISDEANNMKKSARLLSLDHVPDISHAIGSSLKRVFAKQQAYLDFTKQVTSYIRKGAQQDLSYLAPPKQRGKARFLNQDKMVNWAKKMLQNLGKLSKKEYSFFEQLKQHQEMIATLDTCLQLAKKVGLLFKIQGLSFQTVQQANQCARLIKAQTESELTIKFIEQLQGYFKKYEDFLNQYKQQYQQADEDFALHASSDVIESIFGKYKEKANNCGLTGVTRLNLEIPLYSVDRQKLELIIPQAIESKFVIDIKTWTEKHSADNQLVRRIEFFKDCA